ncbi:hypothetical protein K440DRAFT_660656 [Wilcoxina mikolae CBS 423.85]|nr:hypothetical protein K440DRAFT_660656 [Wilcoxina mikolae CBS 423.85]
MEYETQFSIPLFDTGNEGSALRCSNNQGEMQRKHIAQRKDSDLIFQADLFSVVHGTLTPGGDLATLIVMDFRFLGSRSGGRRFRKAEIKIGFSNDDQQIGSDHDPTVCQIAPYETFAMDPSTEVLETTIFSKATASAGLSLSTIGIGAGFERKKSMDRKKYTMMYGMRWIEGRTGGEQNTARWLVWENEIAKNGIPSFLRSAVLVSPRTDGKFQAQFTISAEVDMRYSIGGTIREVLGKAVVDPVYFGSKSKRKNMGPELHDVNPSNMSACDLDAIGMVKTMAIGETERDSSC